MQEGKALGMVEIYGKLGAVECLDASLKAADVSLADMVKVGGGLTTVLIEGDVAAVQASVDAGAAAARLVGQVLSVHVIPRPDENVRYMIWQHRKENTPADTKETICNHFEGQDAEIKTQEEVEKKVEPEEKADMPTPTVIEDESELQHMHVSKLRRIAMATKGYPLAKEEIKKAKKAELIEGFRRHGK